MLKWVGQLEGLPYSFTDFITENNGSKNTGQLKLQGLVTLTESRDQDGGFCTVPGFFKHLEKWTDLTKGTDVCVRANNRYDFVNVPKDDPMVADLTKISARAGAVIIWRGEQPHCNYPNDSTRFRMNQYIKMLPAQEGAPGTDERKATIEKMLNCKITPLGKKLLGLERW